jgi:membrane protein DedA with SNARE-associated domain
MVEAAAAWVDALPDVLVYLILGLGAAVENVIPAIPADTFVVLGGFFSAVGNLRLRWVFLATWVFNVASALAMYRVGHTHGRTFFDVGWGRRLLNPHQMRRMTAFFRRWGLAAIFLARFLPGIRSVVPVFAGVTHQRFWPVAVPLASASALWYGALVWGGNVAGRNLDRVLLILARTNQWLILGASLAAAGVFAWWWRTRHHG